MAAHSFLQARADSRFMRQKYDLFPRDQPDLIIVKEIIPDPVEHHHNAVAKSDDAIDVQEDPDQPCDESAE